MGARPILALALAAFPMSVLSAETLERILRGGADKVAEAGAVVGGGHSIDHDIPLYGLAVTGTVAESRVVRNGGALPGDALVLTKPLGIGVTVCAARADAIAGKGITGIFRKTNVTAEELAEATAVMAALNRGAADAMAEHEVHAATDITGYGLLGHAFEMMSASGTTAEFRIRDVPLLSAARRLAARGIAPEGSRVNFKNLVPRTHRGEGVTDDDLLLLCDAQTSGGLLVALPESQAAGYAAACRDRGGMAAVIGRVLEGGGERPLRVVRE